MILILIEFLTVQLLGKLNLAIALIGSSKIVILGEFLKAFCS